MRMSGRLRENILHDTFSQPACTLVLLEHDSDFESASDITSLLPIHISILLCIGLPFTVRIGGHNLRRFGDRSGKNFHITLLPLFFGGFV